MTAAVHPNQATSPSYIRHYKYSSSSTKHISPTNAPPSTHPRLTAIALAYITESPQICNHDNCLQQFIRSSASLALFCKTYTTAINTEWRGNSLPILNNCPGLSSRLSSACACLMSMTPALTTSSRSNAQLSVYTNTASSSPQVSIKPASNVGRFKHKLPLTLLASQVLLLPLLV
jgi:hypothetical protein